MSRYDDMKDKFGLLKIIREMLTKGETDPRKSQAVVHRIRDEIDVLQRTDPLAKPLTRKWRHYIREDREGGADYVILAYYGQTDAEIQKYVDEEVGYPPIRSPFYSPYDCTGQRFTWDKHWKRTPAGIVIVHRWALDV